MFSAPKFEKSEALEFKSIQTANNKSTKSLTKSQKRRNKKREKQNEQTKETPANKINKNNKVKQGRIEKSKNAKKGKAQQLQMSAAKLKAAAAQMLNQTNDDELESMETESQQEKDSVNSKINSFAAKLKEELKGGRFRFLNEQLYTMNSQKADELFKQDKDAFEAYHAGYRHQVAKWPINPLQRIAKMLRRLPRSLEIGDFGCGEGKLSQMIPHKVYALDLVACRPDIMACDMANTPLSTQQLDVAVYCLSLMGTNLTDYLLECNRVLKINGLVYIAEIQSRFEDVRGFIKTMEACGFELVKKDMDVKVFYFFQFKKVRNVGKVAKIPNFTLKPCLYRKR